MDELKRTYLFTALTRPQMVAGVTYNYVMINGIVAAELFLIFRSVRILLVALAVHGLSAVLCLNEPRIMGLQLTRLQRWPRVPNHRLWRCNSYQP